MTTRTVWLLFAAALASCQGSESSKSFDAGRADGAAPDAKRSAAEAAADGGNNARDAGAAEGGRKAMPGGAGGAGSSAPRMRPSAAGTSADTAKNASCSPGEPAVVTRTRRAPRIWLVIDGSGSTVEPFDGQSSRWQFLRSVLMSGDDGVLKALQAEVAWGLSIFDGPGAGIPITLPDGGVSNAGPIACPRLQNVAPALNNYASIDGAYPAEPPGGSSPTDRALLALRGMVSSAAEPVSLVLLADAQPNDFCTSNQMPTDVGPRLISAVEQLASAGVRTYVVSLARTGRDDQELQLVAAAGGTGKPAYLAANRAQLEQALREISGTAAVCDVDLHGRVAQGKQCSGEVKLDGASLACDAAHGYRLRDPYTLTLQGDACTQYKTHEPSELRAEFPCDAFVPVDDTGACLDAQRCGCESTRIAGSWGSGNGGNLLVVFDRSTSMTMDWHGMPKSQVAITTLQKLLQHTALSPRVAGLFFPSADPNTCACDNNNPNHWLPGPGGCCVNAVNGSCVVTALDAADQIAFTDKAAFSAALPERAVPRSDPSSPLTAALQQADTVLTKLPKGEPRTVIILADGGASCSAGAGTDDLSRLITSWSDAAVHTYLVDLSQATSPAAQPSAFDGVRSAASAVITPDGAQAAIEAGIHMQDGRCHFTFSEPVRDAYLHLIADKDGNAYEVRKSGDARAYSRAGNAVILSQALCEDVLSGRMSDLHFELGCVQAPELPRSN